MIPTKKHPKRKKCNCHKWLLAFSCAVMGFFLYSWLSQHSGFVRLRRPPRCPRSQWAPLETMAWAPAWLRRTKPHGVIKISSTLRSNMACWKIYLLGGWALPLWNIWKSVGIMTFPIYGEKMFQSTNQILFLGDFSIETPILSGSPSLPRSMTPKRTVCCCYPDEVGMGPPMMWEPQLGGPIGLLIFHVHLENLPWKSKWHQV